MIRLIVKLYQSRLGTRSIYQQSSPSESSRKANREKLSQPEWLSSYTQGGLRPGATLFARAAYISGLLNLPDGGQRITASS